MRKSMTEDARSAGKQGSYDDRGAGSGDDLGRLAGERRWDHGRGSGALDGLPVTWAARTGQPGGKTSPEELAAAAHSSCFAMALALRLGEHHTAVQRLAVEATVTLDEVNGLPTVVYSALRVRGRVPGLDAAGFQTTVDEAALLCPMSRLFAGARITVEAVLEPV